MSTKVFGDKGEDRAVTYLKSKGYKILTRNFRSRFGEIDIIALNENILVFVEVKARTSDLFGSPAEAIRRKKLARVIKTSQYFQLLHPHLPKSVRYDAIEVFPDHINHIENITF